MNDFCQYNLYQPKRPNLFIAPPYARKSEGLKDHVKIPNLQLKASDPSKILLLTESLKDTCSRNIEICINKYLIEETDASTVFMLSLIVAKNEAVVQVVGKEVLKVDIHLSAEESILQRIMDEPHGLQFPLEILPPELCDVVSTLIPKTRGDVYGYALYKQVVDHGVTIFTENCQIIVMVVNSPLQRMFVSQIVNEMFRFCLALLVSMFKNENETRYRKQANIVLESSRKFYQNYGNLNQLLLDVVSEAKEMTSCELGRLYLFDEANKYLVPQIFECTTDAKPEKWPKSQGLLGYVYVNKTILNVKNPKDHPLFLSSEDQKFGLETRNILAFPLYSNNKIVAVMQLLNKSPGNFNIYDEELISVFSHHAGAAIEQALDVKELHDTVMRNKISTEHLIYYPIKMRGADIRHVIYAKMPCYENLFEMKFNAREIPVHQTVVILMKFFEELSFFQFLNIDRKALAQFLLYVERGYKDLPYHNWNRAFIVTHFAFSTIMSLHLMQRNILNEMEALAILIACICQDIDYKGVINLFYPTNTLNILYSSAGSVMQHHAFSQVIAILNTEGCNFLTGLSTDDYSKCLTLVKKNMLATDIARHFNNLKTQERLFSNKFKYKDPICRNLFAHLIITCADLCEQTRGWPTAKLVAGQMYEEYFQLGDLDVAMGLQLPEEESSIPDLQIEFLRDTCMPVFRLLTKMFPEAEFCVQSVLYVIRCWEVAKKMFLYRKTGVTPLDMLRSSTLNITESLLCLLESGEGDNIEENVTTNPSDSETEL